MRRDNNLYKKRRNRYLKKRGLKPVTVGIAAICDMLPRAPDFPPKIVLCADRLMSSGVQFEAGESKIKKITDYHYAICSSTDSLISDLILERVKEKAREGDVEKTEEIVTLLKQECLGYKQECIERDVLFKYNVLSENLKVDPRLVLEEATEEVVRYEYPLECDFIVVGLEPTKEAHIFRVDQDGDYRLDDSLGFTTIGSGGMLAFLELTRYVYSRDTVFTMAIPLVYFAKKISERAEGVGRFTDFGILHFPVSPETANKPVFFSLSVQGFIQKLDKAYRRIRMNERRAVNKLIGEISNMFPPKKT